MGNEQAVKLFLRIGTRCAFIHVVVVSFDALIQNQKAIPANTCPRWASSSSRTKARCIPLWLRTTYARIVCLRFDACVFGEGNAAMSVFQQCFENSDFRVRSKLHSQKTLLSHRQILGLFSFISPGKLEFYNCFNSPRKI
eukprot:gb/GECG01003904.1/.p1 GENE.gb/GECG01003904.1/~~gb/GECG01003904.1/.p1  ORF type:complete len:140 (+),score=6.58 gb/GECG01003904.1/:1-420(+)